MLEVDSDTWNGVADSSDGMDEVSMNCAAGSKFLDLLSLMKSPLVITSHNYGASGDPVK